MDSRPHIAGNCYDYVDPATGVLMNLYGSHLFHTNMPRVWNYVTEISEKKNGPVWEPWYHQKVGVVNDTYVPIPPNIKTVNTLFHMSIQTEEEMLEWLESVQIRCPEEGCQNGEQMALSRVGEGLYKAIFETYTIKQWNKSPAEMDASVTARIPVRSNFDPRYFSDKYQALPSSGYTSWFVSALDHPLIDVALETDFFEHRKHFEKHCKKIVYTGPIDRYFADEMETRAGTSLETSRNLDSKMEKLEYRSLEFFQERYYNHPGYVLPTPVLNFPGPETPYTRAVEYKQYLHRGGQHSIVIRETSSDKGEPYYPVPTTRNQNLYNKYKEMAEKLEATGKIQFVGRLANYKYFNMDQAIDNALDLFYHGEHNHWSTLLVGENFETYKASIDAKMQRMKVERAEKFANTAPCETSFYDGEFGTEMRAVVPWYYSKSQTCSIKTTGVSGTKYMYFFSDDHTIEHTTRQNRHLPAGNPFNSTVVHMADFPYDTPWLAPPFREFFHRNDIVEKLGDKPLIFISNKYRREHHKRPANYLGVDTLREILKYLTPKYTVVYKRFTQADQKDWEENEKDLGEKEMIRKEFPDVVLFQPIGESLADPEDVNLLMFSLMASSEGFISIQGGMAVASSYFGKKNNILIKTGTELKTGDYGYFHRFSNAKVSWQQTDKSLIASIKEQY